MRVAILVALAAVSGCSWFHGKSAVPPPTQFVVTGAPRDSLVFIDGSQAGAANSSDGRPQLIDVAPGPHTLEIYVGDTVVYREDSDALSHRKTFIRVLSGPNR